MRISEALNLQFEDVTADGLWIRNTKFGKSRFIPLHPTAVSGLEKYIVLRRRVVGADSHVFISVHGRKLAHSVVHYEFQKVVRSLEFHKRPGQPHPRIHDMRHSFATRALESCPEGRDAIARHMVELQGGTIRAESELNAGSNFLVVLPKADLAKWDPDDLSAVG